MSKTMILDTPRYPGIYGKHVVDFIDLRFEAATGSTPASAPWTKSYKMLVSQPKGRVS